MYSSATLSFLLSCQYPMQHAMDTSSVEGKGSKGILHCHLLDAVVLLQMQISCTILVHYASHKCP